MFKLQWLKQWLDAQPANACSDVCECRFSILNSRLGIHCRADPCVGWKLEFHKPLRKLRQKKEVPLWVLANDLEYRVDPFTRHPLAKQVRHAAGEDVSQTDLLASEGGHGRVPRGIQSLRQERRLEPLLKGCDASAAKGNVTGVAIRTVVFATGDRIPGPLGPLNLCRGLIVELECC